MAATQSMFTGRQGGGSHTTDRHTQVTRKVAVDGLHFVRRGVWFCGVLTRSRAHLSALDLPIVVDTRFFPFLTIVSMPSLNVTIQK